MSTMKDIYSGFYTLEDYLNSPIHLNRSQIARELVEYLINKITEKPQIKCMIQERGDKAIIFVPISLIEEGKAEKGMQNKNIITVWYYTNRIDVEIEDRNNKDRCFLKEDINDKMIERIYDIYKRIN
jgi:hypothetical protein